MSETPAAASIPHRSRTGGCWLSTGTEMAATTTQAMGSLPSGLGICTTAPDIFYLPELVSRLRQSSDLEGQISRTILIFHDDLIQFCQYMRGGKNARQDMNSVQKHLGREVWRENVHLEGWWHIFPVWEWPLHLSSFIRIVLVRLIWERMWPTPRQEKGHATSNNRSVVGFIYLFVFQR